MESWSRWSKAARLESEYTSKTYHGFESHTLRQRIFKYGCNFAVLDGGGSGAL